MTPVNASGRPTIWRSHSMTTSSTSVAAGLVCQLMPCDAEPGRDEVAEHGGEVGVGGEVGEEAGVVPVRDARQDDAVEVGDDAREAVGLLRAARRAAAPRTSPGCTRLITGQLADVLAVVGDPVDQLVAERAELVGVHGALRVDRGESLTRSAAARDHDVRAEDQSVTVRAARPPSVRLEQAAEPERAAAADERRVHAPHACQRRVTSARRRRAARGEARQGEQAPGPEHAVRLGDERRPVVRAEQVEHVGADEAVAGAVVTGQLTEPSVSSTRARSPHGATAARARSTMRGLTSRPR